MPPVADQHSPLLDVTAENFMEVVFRAKRPILLSFWSPFCEACQHEEPEVIQLASQLAGSAGVARIDAAAHPELVLLFGVVGVPATVILYRGQIVDSWGGQSSLRSARARLTEWTS